MMKECMANIETIEFTLEDGKKGKSYINFDERCLIGAKLPNFKTKSIDGLKYERHNLKGKINIINFWFKACKPCIAEIPGLNMIVNKYGKNKINYFSISRDKKEILEKFLIKNEFQFIHLLNGKEIIQNDFEHKSGYPTTIVTDKKLRIVEIFTGGKSDSKAIDEIVNKLEPIIDKLIDK